MEAGLIPADLAASEGRVIISVQIHAAAASVQGSTVAADFPAVHLYFRTTRGISGSPRKIHAALGILLDAASVQG